MASRSQKSDDLQRLGYRADGLLVLMSVDIAYERVVKDCEKIFEPIYDTKHFHSMPCEIFEILVYVCTKFVKLKFPSNSFSRDLGSLAID